MGGETDQEYAQDTEEGIHGEGEYQDEVIDGKFNNNLLKRNTLIRNIKTGEEDMGGEIDQEYAQETVEEIYGERENLAYEDDGEVQYPDKEANQQ